MNMECKHTHTRAESTIKGTAGCQQHYSQSFEGWQSEESAWFNQTDHVTPQVPVETKRRLKFRSRAANMSGCSHLWIIRPKPENPSAETSIISVIWNESHMNVKRTCTVHIFTMKQLFVFKTTEQGRSSRLTDGDNNEEKASSSHSSSVSTASSTLYRADEQKPSEDPVKV